MKFDEWAPEALPSLLQFARVLCGERGTAEDVVQDVLIKAHANWPKIELLDQPDAYVRRMVVNEYVSWRRKWARVLPSGGVIVAGSVADHAGAHADRDQLTSALARLPRRRRAVMVLRYYNDLSDPEIAEAMGCSASAVRAYASRALASLRLARIQEEAAP